MEPALYKNCLEYIAWRDSLPSSSLYPVQIAELLAIEDHLGAALPCQYSDWLLKAGTGSEYGGLSLWYHCDLTREDSVVHASHRYSPQHRELCVFFNSLDGELFAFLKEPKGWSKEVYIIDEQTRHFEYYTVDFASFLSQNLDCNEEEISRLREEQPACV